MTENNNLYLINSLFIANEENMMTITNYWEGRNSLSQKQYRLSSDNFYNF